MVKQTGVDKTMIAVVSGLILFGLIMVYSSTMILAKEKFGDSLFFLKKQLIWLLIGMILTVSVMYLKRPLYLSQKWVYFGIFLSLVGLVLVFWSGKVNNCYAWIRFGGISIQPSEFAKIAVVLYLSYHLGKRNNDVNQIKKLMLQLSPLLLIFILIVKEPDYGTFLIILVVTFILLFVAGLKTRYFVAVFLVMVPLFIGLSNINPHVKKRVLGFLNPDAYQATYNFQSLQSVYAIGSGGIFGQGLGNSTQKLFFLPYPYTDFIYSIIGEEVGLLGSLGVLALYSLFMIRALRIANLSGNRHTYLMVVGLGFMIFFQAIVNISVTLRMFPPTGVPLPFISSGGSSLISSLICVGIILNISKHRKMVLLND